MLCLNFILPPSFLAVADPITWAVVAQFLWNTAVYSAISMGISMGIWYLSHRKEKGAENAAIPELQLPTITEGRPYSVIFGTCEVESYVISWWGALQVIAVWDYYYRTTKRGGPFNRKRKYYIRAWKYKIGAHFKLCLGVIDGIKRIKFDKETVWPTTDPDTLNADGATSAYINQPDIFGGDKSQGGVKGYMDIQYGGAAQTKNSYLVSKQGSDIPASRGVVGVILKDFYIGTSPYPKMCSFICKRTDLLTTGDTQWYAAKAEIGTGMLNPAHIIRESLTNAEWGLGHSTGLMDDTSFEAAADTLYDEGFGLSYEWNPKAMDIDTFIESVAATINGMVEEDLSTGKFVLKLTRDDYVIGNLETFSTDDIIDVKDFYRELTGKTVNELVVNYKETLSNTVISITQHDIALIDREGEVISATVDFPSITDETLIGKVAQRELRQISSNLAILKIRCKRTMQHLRPNDVFILAWPALGIVQLVLRVLSIDYGTLRNGEVTIRCMEDIFETGTAAYANVPGTNWTSPISQPAASPARELIETPFFEILQVYGEDATLALDENIAFLMVAAMTPSGDALDYEILVRDGPTEELITDGSADFTPTGTLVGAMLLNAVDVDITLTGDYGLDEDFVGTYMLIEDELVLIKTLNDDTKVVGVARGVLDTVPAAHIIGTRVWFVDAIAHVVGTEYTNGDTPGVKILPRTGLGEFPESSATAYDADAFDDRQIRPYPPGDFKVNSVSYPSSFSGQPTITWKHRDRLQQLEEIIEHDNASIGPEAGTTYTLSIYDETGTNLLRTVSGITGTSYNYNYDDEIADSGLQSGDSLNSSLRFVLKSVRSGYDSWQSYDLTVDRA